MLKSESKQILKAEKAFARQQAAVAAGMEAEATQALENLRGEGQSRANGAGDPLHA
jgi:hypothetical protein